jgi:hypothetical protein
MKSRLWIVTIAIAVACFAACNYTDGACWPVGQTDGNAGVGTGPIVQSGAGGSLGDGPSQGTSGAACNSSPQEPATPQMPATDFINCRARGLDAAACSDVCLTAGASCVPFALHPNKSGLEPGKLTSCKNGWPTTTCTWTFSNNDGCALVTTYGVKLKWICRYDGG